MYNPVDNGPRAMMSEAEQRAGISDMNCGEHVMTPRGGFWGNSAGPAGIYIYIYVNIINVCMYIRISSVYRVTAGKSAKVFLSFTREPRTQPTFSVNIPRNTQYYYSVSQSNERASAFNAVSENCSMRMPTIGTLKFRRCQAVWVAR